MKNETSGKFGYGCPSVATTLSGGRSFKDDVGLMEVGMCYLESITQTRMVKKLEEQKKIPLKKIPLKKIPLKKIPLLGRRHVYKKIPHLDHPPT